MISYRPNVHDLGMYCFSFEARQMDYERYVRMDDAEFTSKLEYVIHYAMHICFIKEQQTQFILADDGVIHELHHLLIERLEGKPGDDPTRLARARELFRKKCFLGDLQ